MLMFRGHSTQIISHEMRGYVGQYVRGKAEGLLEDLRRGMRSSWCRKRRDRRRQSVVGQTQCWGAYIRCWTKRDIVCEWPASQRLDASWVGAQEGSDGAVISHAKSQTTPLLHFDLSRVNVQWSEMAQHPPYAAQTQGDWIRRCSSVANNKARSGALVQALYIFMYDTSDRSRIGRLCL